jgi:hypothetical protein
MNRFTLYFSIATLLISLSWTVLTSAQQMRELRPLSAQDFKCLQSLECIQNSESLKAKGWSFVFDNTVEKFAQELTAKMEGKNISFFAVYDKQGKLIESEYKRFNIALPSELLSYLAENNNDKWLLTGSEMIMQNFDESTIYYNVTLEKQSQIRSESYDMAFINTIDVEAENYAVN